MSWKDTTPKLIQESAFKLVGDDWMLITAGPIDHFNTMTASWGGFGVIWNKPVVWCVIRPQRYTYEFIEAADNFTLSFLPEEYRDALFECGTKSGRDSDKVTDAGLHPVAGFTPETTVFTEARIIMECKKLYTQDIDPARFLDPAIDTNYPEKDYHRMYLGEIVRCASK
jgi:flavin reductase (DIM6/NTAB) family NADH-FMN oxidoreductase RutF